MAIKQLAKLAIRNGNTVLNNEPTLINWVTEQEYNPIIVVPTDLRVVLERIGQRDGFDSDFYKLVRDQGPVWMRYWISQAERNHIPIISSNSLEDVVSQLNLGDTGHF